LKSLSIIGCGNAGRTLARLWHDSGTFRIDGILNSTPESSREAVAFIGAGEAAANVAELPASDIILIGCPDERIRSCCERLATGGRLGDGSILFHLSGALSSCELAAARHAGAAVASTHPLMSFADPAAAIENFAGTWCGCEGDPAALERLEPAFESIGARLFRLDAADKSLYHAASVIACNYLVALEEISLRTFEQAGVERRLALQLLEPILHGTVNNIVTLGPTAALTGPIARGDADTVARQLELLDSRDAETAGLYRRLGWIAAGLAEIQGKAPAERLARIRELLQE
jgi:predicted short-subunit dehydrogenase-like oxidoreductase (DUF2520 family)